MNNNELLALAERLEAGHAKVKELARALHIEFKDSSLLEAAAMIRKMAEQKPVVRVVNVHYSGVSANPIYTLVVEWARELSVGTNLYALPVAQPSFDWQKSCHYTAENINAIIADLRAVEDGTESIEWMNRDHKTKAGILWRVILALSHDVPVAQPSEHPDDDAVDAFAAAMKAKLARKRAEGRGGWSDKDVCSNEVLSAALREHVERGDPVDVANFAMMLHQRGESIAQPSKEWLDEAMRLAHVMRIAWGAWDSTPSGPERAFRLASYNAAQDELKAHLGKRHD
jgi:hypothetical protein